jgi:hypothetical protein
VTATGKWQLWSGFLPGPVQPQGRLRATDGATTIELGFERQGSLSACGPYVYWPPGPDNKQIVRWHPGGPVESVYAATGDVDNAWVYGYLR